MQYMLMLIGPEPDFESISPEEMQATIEMMGEYNKALQEAGALVAANGLRARATTTTVRFDDEGETVVTDGPFAETKEQLMGYWVIECSSLDEALAWTKKVPMRGASIEVRPLVEERGDLLERLGRRADAHEAYGRALELARNSPERRFLERRRAAVALVDM